MLFICFFQDSGYLLNFQQQSEEKILEQEDFFFCSYLTDPWRGSAPCLYFICHIKAVEVGPLLSCLEDDLHIITASVLYFTLIFYIPYNSRKALSWKHSLSWEHPASLVEGEIQFLGHTVPCDYKTPQVQDNTYFFLWVPAEQLPRARQASKHQRQRAEDPASIKEVHWPSNKGPLPCYKQNGWG